MTGSLREGATLNSTLGTNTTLTEAARFIAYSKEEPTLQDKWRTKKQNHRAIHRLIEFCILAESVVLNNVIYTLPRAEPKDMNTLELLKRLRDEIIDSLIDLRKQFKSFREDFTELETVRNHAKSIVERRRIRNKIKLLFESVSKNSKAPENMTLESAIGYTVDLAKVAKSPLDLDSYVTFLRKGAESVQSRWTARPAHKLFSTTKKIEHLPNYISLVKSAIGRDLTNDEISEFSKLYNNLLKMKTRW